MLAAKLVRGAGGGGARGRWGPAGAGSGGWASSPRPGASPELAAPLAGGEDGHLWARPAESARGLVHRGERVGYEALAFGEH